MSRPRLTSVQPPTTASETTESGGPQQLAAQAISLYGAQAPMMVALCGLDAWFDGKDEELYCWTDVFQRLGN